jgi:trimethylamine--corrinoid protein Co-methyltransferase
MKNGSFVTGSPEMMLIHTAALQMVLDFYKLPTRSMCGMTDSKIIDYQAGAETMQNLMVGVLSGAHIVFECLGVLDAIMTTSYEKLIIDLEMVSRVIRIRNGIDSSQKDRDLKVIQEIAQSGDYITHPDTLARFREQWRPSMSTWESYENWQASGAEDVAMKASRKYKEILAAAPQSLIDPEVDKALNDYIQSVI